MDYPRETSQGTESVGAWHPGTVQGKPHVRAGRVGDQVLLDPLWRSERFTTLSFEVDDPARLFQNLFGSGWQVATLVVLNP